MTMRDAEFGLMLFDLDCGLMPWIECWCSDLTGVPTDQLASVVRQRARTLERLDDEQLALVIRKACRPCKTGSTTPGGSTNTQNGGGSQPTPTPAPKPNGGTSSSQLLDCYKRADEWICAHPNILGAIDIVAAGANAVGLPGMGSLAADFSRIRTACQDGVFKAGDTANARDAMRSLCKIRAAVQVGGLLASVSGVSILAALFATATFWDCCTFGGITGDVLDGQQPSPPGGGGQQQLPPSPQGGGSLPLPGVPLPLPPGPSGGGGQQLPPGPSPLPQLPPVGGGSGGQVGPFVPQAPPAGQGGYGGPNQGDVIQQGVCAGVGAVAGAACVELGPLSFLCAGAADALCNKVGDVIRK